MSTLLGVRVVCRPGRLDCDWSEDCDTRVPPRPAEVVAALRERATRRLPLFGDDVPDPSPRSIVSPPWTAAEDAVVLSGLSVAEVARRTGRTAAAIHNRRARLRGGRRSRKPLSPRAFFCRAVLEIVTAAGPAGLTLTAIIRAAGLTRADCARVTAALRRLLAGGLIERIPQRFNRGTYRRA